MKFNPLDITVLVIIVLFFIYGIMKGFIKPCISLVGWGVAIALIYFVAAKFGEMLMGTAVGTWVESLVGKTTGILGNSRDFTVVNVGGEWVFAHDNSSVIALLESKLILPNFLVENIMANMTVGTLEVNVISSLKAYAGQFLASVIILVGTGIIFFVIKIFVGRAIYGRPVGVVNRILGSILYLAIGVMFVFLAFSIMNAVIGMFNTETAINISKMMNEGFLTQYIMKYNPIDMIFNLINAA